MSDSGGFEIQFTINSAHGALAILEKTVWHNNGGEWTEDNRKPVVYIWYSGSGLIRFQDHEGNRFSVVVGCSNYTQKIWCDAQTRLARGDTGTKLLPEYYNGGKLSHETHTEIERQTESGRTVRVSISNHNYWVIQAVVDFS
ncbi:fungal fruit body lectin [Aspergillus crustosus]